MLKACPLLFSFGDSFACVFLYPVIQGFGAGEIPPSQLHSGKSGDMEQLVRLPFPTAKNFLYLLKREERIAEVFFIKHEPSLLSYNFKNSMKEKRRSRRETILRWGEISYIR